MMPGLERRMTGPEVMCYEQVRNWDGSCRQNVLTSNKCFPTAGRSLTTGTPADSNSSAAPIPLTNRRCGEEMAPAERMTSLFAAIRYLSASSDVAT